ncbi:MAG: DUF4255 domain-containing protein [Gammaproteobacteria bacterium]|nr:DUF4255 domain-containing protein [Gammaproteobacteria bacterium]
MASYKAINGIMVALEDFLKSRLPEEIEVDLSANIRLLNSKDLAVPLSGNFIGLYLYRVIADTQGRNRYLRSAQTPPQPELPINLHFLLIVNGGTHQIEMDLLGWAMQQFSSAIMFDVGDLREADPLWGENETLQVSMEHLSTEDLFRIWEALKASYSVSIPYVIKTLRLLPEPLTTNGNPVTTQIYSSGLSEPPSTTEEGSS